MHKVSVWRGLVVALLGVIAWQICQAAKSEGEKPAIAARVDKLLIMNSETTDKEKYPWGWIQWLRSAKLDKDAPMTFGIVEIEPGTSNPLHLHPNCEEYLYVLSGSCNHVVGDQFVRLKKGDLARIPKGVPHKATVLGDEPLKAIIVYSSGDRQFRVLEAGGVE